MGRSFEDSYYHGSSGSGNRHEDERRNNLRDGDFGREYENRYRNQDGRNRKSYDDYKNSNESYFPYTPNQDESRVRRGYGIDDSVGGGYGYDSDRNGNDRIPGQTAKGGYGTVRMGGYSGSAFGGSNYSSKGSFGGDQNYGSMSGGGGNMSRSASSSGYGSSLGNKDITSDRGIPNYGINRESPGSGMGSTYGGTNDGGGTGYSNGPSGNTWGGRSSGNSSGNYGGYGSTFSGVKTYKGYGTNNRTGSGKYSGSSDRGGYTDFDPNTR